MGVTIAQIQILWVKVIDRTAEIVLSIQEQVPQRQVLVDEVRVQGERECFIRVQAEIKHHIHHWKVRGLNQKVAHHQAELCLFLLKSVYYGPMIINVGLLCIVPVFNIDTTILSVLFS